MPIRLQKYLSHCGIASRRKAEQLILEGLVKVNSTLVLRLGTCIDPEKDTVTVSGKKALPQKKVYVILNKPRGVLCTMKDELGRKIISSLLHSIRENIFHVGRLDRESEGLLFMTNDGDFANRIAHPKAHIPKTYRVEALGALSEKDVRGLRKGLFIEGRKTLPAKVVVKKNARGKILLEMTLFEGRNRQIRKMLHKLDCKVTRLVRTSIGNICLGSLPSGHFKTMPLKEAEHIFS